MCGHSDCYSVKLCLPFRYGMLASVSGILKGEMGQHLEVIVRRMMETLTSEEGVKVRASVFFWPHTLKLEETMLSFALR